MLGPQGLPLRLQPLPRRPDLRLWLLPPGPESLQAQATILEQEFHWACCWPSGHALAEWMGLHPLELRGRRVLDFGSGSGVVAVAAALAGAAQVVAVEKNPEARQAILANALANGVQVEVWEAFEGHWDLIVAADALYRVENLSWLELWCERAERVLVADGRRELGPPFVRLAQREVEMVPALPWFEGVQRLSIYCNKEFSNCSF